MAAERKRRVLEDADIRTTWTRMPSANFTFRPRPDRTDMAWRDGGGTGDGINQTDNDRGDGLDWQIWPPHVKAR